MHGLIFRTIEDFVTHTFGADRWQQVVTAARIEVTAFEAMLQYDAAYLPQLLDGCAQVLDRAPSMLLEDIGTYLVTNPARDAVRRLMRFGGVDFVELLYSLDDLPGRTRLAIPDLDLPMIEVAEHGGGQFSVSCHGGPQGFGHVLVGVLRSMADDYGTLAVLTHRGDVGSPEMVDVSIVDVRHAEDRGFSLAPGAAVEGPG